MFAKTTHNMDCSKVILDVSDPDFVMFRFFSPDGPERLTVYVSLQDSEHKYQFFSGIEPYDSTILMEEKLNVSEDNTTE